MIQRSLLIIFFSFCFLVVNAQSDFFKSPVWSISVYNHSAGLGTKKPLNLGVAFGAEFTYKQKDVSSWHQKIEIGWFHHKNLNTAFWLKTDVVRRYTSGNGIYGEVQLGVGYLYDIPAYRTFTLDDTGSFQPSKTKGKGGFITDVGIGGGYAFNIDDKYTIAPFIKYEGMIQIPYSDFLPLFPHSLLHIGSRIKL